MEALRIETFSITRDHTFTYFCLTPVQLVYSSPAALQTISLPMIELHIQNTLSRVTGDIWVEQSFGWWVGVCVCLLVIS